jgi:hypothetical protein
VEAAVRPVGFSSSPSFASMACRGHMFQEDQLDDRRRGACMWRCERGLRRRKPSESLHGTQLSADGPRLAAAREHMYAEARVRQHMKGKAGSHQSSSVAEKTWAATAWRHQHPYSACIRTRDPGVKATALGFPSQPLVWFLTMPQTDHCAFICVCVLTIRESVSR